MIDMQYFVFELLMRMYNDNVGDVIGTKWKWYKITWREVEKIVVENEIEKNIKIRKKILGITLNEKELTVCFLAYVLNPGSEKIEKVTLNISDEICGELELNIYTEKISKYRLLKENKIIYKKFNVSEILEKNININNPIQIRVHLENDIVFKYNLPKRNKKYKKCTRMYYVPLKSMYIDNYSLVLRRTAKGNWLLSKRLKEEIENTKKFITFENKHISRILYGAGKIAKLCSFKKVNLYYEKFAQKKEEGTFELCKLNQESKKSKNYFIIDENSSDYEKIKDEKFVVKKYSLKYYWLAYRANNIISTEAPMHINVLRSNNKLFRKAIYEKPNVFLQHGIIYLKNMHDSAFVKRREAEPAYILASSQKEKDVIVEQLKLDEKQIMVTGIPMYSQIEHKHINESYDDIVTVMLTWKPYEEHLYNFEESSYYKNVVEICGILSKYIDKEKIRIVPHPKVKIALEQTDLKENVYSGEISEILKVTKLLISDYSSVVYNSFYQGSAIVFYQDDIEVYEEAVGKLIPAEDEYIGKRAFGLEELETIIKDGVKDKKIDISSFRNKEHEEIYKLINEFTDGKNLERINQELKKKKMI